MANENICPGREGCVCARPNGHAGSCMTAKVLSDVKKVLRMMPCVPSVVKPNQRRFRLMENEGLAEYDAPTETWKRTSLGDEWVGPVEPRAAKTEGRICFGIRYYKTEAEANLAAEFVRARGETYNGGFFHGMPCGRDDSHDHVDPVLGQLYAVTTA